MPTTVTNSADKKGYYAMSYSYYQCAQALFEKFQREGKLIIHNDKKTGLLRNPFPVYYMCSHALELYFKTFILCNNSPVRGHDLISIANDCIKYGLRLNCEDIKQITLLNNFNKPIDLSNKNNNYVSRYPASGSFDLPETKILLDLLDRLDKLIEPLCL